MSTHLNLRFLLFALLIAPVFCRADEVTFATSSTHGCFTASVCTPTSNQSSTGQGDLSFLGSSFGPGTTSNGNLRINLGQFTLTDQSTTFIDSDFYSTITFTMPVTIAGGQSTSVFTAEVLGLVSHDQFGAVVVDFDETPQHFTFSNSQYTGSFDFNVDSLLFGDLGSGSKTVSWNGVVSNAVETRLSQVPEPSVLCFLGSGLLSIGFLRKYLPAALT